MVLLQQPVLSQLAALALRVLLNRPRKTKTGNDSPPALLLTNAIYKAVRERGRQRGSSGLTSQESIKLGPVPLERSIGCSCRGCSSPGCWQRDPADVPSLGGLCPGCAPQHCRGPVLVFLLFWMVGTTCLPVCWAWLWGAVLLSRTGNGFAGQRPLPLNELGKCLSSREMVLQL